MTATTPFAGQSQQRRLSGSRPPYLLPSASFSPPPTPSRPVTPSPPRRGGAYCQVGTPALMPPPTSARAAAPPRRRRGSAIEPPGPTRMPGSRLGGAGGATRPPAGWVGPPPPSP
ncbi:hypothetical protein I4F81_000899 [Pyropia yezoensis]|uniref:Uncharacterized protein n=1 Tax=Pyropia yezoensis TaxID=2788 RepID=A0ACC3BKL1_PYRYE|nr:hypothetical protein I4F81_000899 [Neopyropia yezoensis]